VAGTETGKTHLTTVLGLAALDQVKRVRFYNTVDFSISWGKRSMSAKPAL
jgi:DNA replication protein DnaC